MSMHYQYQNNADFLMEMRHFEEGVKLALTFSQWQNIGHLFIEYYDRHSTRLLVPEIACWSLETLGYKPLLVRHRDTVGGWNDLLGCHREVLFLSADDAALFALKWL